MPEMKRRRKLTTLRHAEYYNMQEVFDDLYARSKNGEVFDDILKFVLLRENILLAYRNMKANLGSNTPGTDKQTIKDIGALSPEEMVERVRYILIGSKHGYRPKPIRRKEIPKPNGQTRPLGIPCVWDRLIQQCIKQILEPICEAKFSENSYGFRPAKSVEQAIQRSYTLMQRSHMYYVVEFDIKGFFDNVNHSKLIKQLWSLGIRDKNMIYIMKCILKAPIKMPDGTIEYPEKGTPQGGILSPLLANVVLNELDHWIDSQWQEHPIAQKHAIDMSHRGKGVIRSNGYRIMRKSNLKEMYIVRYADDFRIFCRNKTVAITIRIAVTKWLKERLKLDISKEKTKVRNLRKQYSEFLGFKMRLQRKGQAYRVKSHMSDKNIIMQTDKFKKQIVNIAHPRDKMNEKVETMKYNAMVLGMQNYYRIATEISLDCRKIQYAVMLVVRKHLAKRLGKMGRVLTDIEKKRYGKSKMLRYTVATKEPLYPIGYIKHKPPKTLKRITCFYTKEGREYLHTNLEIDMRLVFAMMSKSEYRKSSEYADNRISLYSAQYGKCFITGYVFQTTDEIHCHHKIPLSKGGTDQYANLVLVHEYVHTLIHATKEETIRQYLAYIKLTATQMDKLNKLRILVGNKEINIEK